MKLNGQIGALNRKWNNRKIEQQANELQKAADSNNMKPLWDYQKNLKKHKNKSKHTTMYTEEKTETQDTNQTLKRWTQWIQQHFSQTTQENKNIEIEHIKEQTWNEMESALKNDTTKISQPPHPNLCTIREHTQLIKAQQKHPQITEMLLKDYTTDDVQQAIKQLKNNKAHGTDGIPAEAFKAIGNWITEPLTIMLNHIKNGQQLPKTWKNGAVVHIYKNKGDEKECDNYRPICLLEIVYKIWSNLVTKRLSQILHIITSNNQYGYKEKNSTIDAIMKVEQYLTTKNNATNILLMDLSKAFDTVNRTILWTSLYKAGLPIQLILHIRRGHIETTLQAKHNKLYGGGNQQQHRSFPRLSHKRVTLYNLPTRYDGRLPSTKLHTKNTIQRNEPKKRAKQGQHTPHKSTTTKTNTTKQKQRGKTDNATKHNTHSKRKPTRYDKNTHNRENITTKIKQQRKNNKNIQEPKDQIKKSNEDEIIYADDTKLFLPNEDNPEQILQKLNNYKDLTKTRKLKINWNKVRLLTNKRNSVIKKFPPPYNEIQTTKNITILGKKINVHNNTGPAVLQRIQQAKTMWRKLKYKLFTNKKITLQIRILLWNATIRATLTYGLQTKTLTNEQYNKLERFTNNCHREMLEPNWILQLKEQKYTSQEQINSKLTQPSIKTWLQKLRLSHHAHQTKATWTIHTQDNEAIQETEQLWKNEWETTKTMIQQEINKTTKEPNKKLNTYLFRHKSKKKQQQKIIKLMKKRNCTEITRNKTITTRNMHIHDLKTTSSHQAN